MFRIETLESDVETNTAAVKEHSEELKENSERLTRIEDIVENESLGDNNRHKYYTSNETSKAHYITCVALNDTIMTIKANIDKQTEMTNDYFQNYTARITKLEVNKTAYQHDIDHLTKAVSEFNDTIKQLEAVQTEHNDSLNTSKQILGKLEADIAFHEARLAKLETSHTMENAILETHSSEIVKLQTDQFNIVQITANHTYSIMQIETAMEKQISSDEFANKAMQLESDINTTRADIEDISFKMRLLENNVTTWIGFSYNQSSRMNDLESKLISIQDIVADYNETVGQSYKVNHFVI